MIVHAKRLAKKAQRFLLTHRLSRAELCTCMQNLGVRHGGVLLVHSSLSALGYVPGGGRTVIEALQNVVGPTGTLAFPTHTWEWMDAGLRAFDVNTAKGCVGTIAEIFRRLPDAKRSLHPTHSVAALGPLAVELIKEHELAETPCGMGTPYAKLLDLKGQILLIGCGLEANTAFHTIEALAGLPYLMEPSAEQFSIVDSHGVTKSINVKRHKSGIKRRFVELEASLVDVGAARRHRIGNTAMILLDGELFKSHMMRAIHLDPDLLIDRT